MTLPADIARIEALADAQRSDPEYQPLDAAGNPIADAQHPEQQPDIDAFLGEGRKPVRSLASVMVPSARDPEQQPVTEGPSSLDELNKVLADAQHPEQQPAQEQP